MKLGIVIHSTDAETVWNAFRLGVFALKQGDAAKVFLLAKGVECESLDTDAFPVIAMMKELVSTGGTILACGPASSSGIRMAPSCVRFPP